MTYFLIVLCLFDESRPETKSVFQIRIRIGTGINWVSGSGPKSRESEMTNKKKKKINKFHVLLLVGRRLTHLDRRPFIEV
jgi:hypothetical protein